MLYAVIPAGGSGTRLWPLSRAANPKFLHALTGTPATLLQATVERLAPLTGPEHTYVVTGVAHAAAVARQLPDLPEENLLVEPAPRDSCAAIGLAAAIIATRDPQGVMGAFAADHLIADGARFVEVLRGAVTGAEQGYLMTVGIQPTRPETGYGYLECDGALDGEIRRVDQFKEKPSQQVAEEYLRSGHHFWNAGMFVWRVDVFLAELERQQPELHAGLSRIAAAWHTPEREAVLGEVWPTLKKISVDYAVMEGAAGAGLVATVPGDFGWNDIGDFATLGEVLPGAEGTDNVVVDPGEKPEVLLLDSTGLVVVPHSGRLVAALGLHDMIVVDTPDALLVCPRERAQDVKQIVDALKEAGQHRLT
jgi:mannose-1-phosphate guanylyltransferase